MPPGLAAVARLLQAACRRLNAPVVFLCFYSAARLSRSSRAACRVPCKRSLTRGQSQYKDGLFRDGMVFSGMGISLSR